MGSLQTRIRRLQDTSGGDCPRCSGVFAMIVNGEFSSASRHGEALTEEEWRRFEAEEEDGRCPVCGVRPTNISIGRAPGSGS